MLFALLMLCGTAMSSSVQDPMPIEGLVDLKPENLAGEPTALYSKKDGAALLDPTRLKFLLETIEEAGVSEAFWVVLQDKQRAEDALLRLERQSTGPEFLLTHAAWISRGIAAEENPRAAYRARTGDSAPKKGAKEVIVQGFQKRTELLFQHRPVTVSKRQGLLKLLPENAVLREARKNPNSPQPQTVALVFYDAYLYPAKCVDEEQTHIDQAKIELVLVDDQQILATTTLADDSKLSIPRTECIGGDEDQAREITHDWVSKLAKRPMTNVLEWKLGEPLKLVTMNESYLIKIKNNNGKYTLETSRLE